MTSAASLKVAQAQVLAVVSGNQIQVSQAQVEVVAGKYPTGNLQVAQAQVLVAAKDSTHMRVAQAQIIAVVKMNRDVRHLRAWRFPQDDHEFYVLNLVNGGTIEYDKLTGQWAKWTSPDTGDDADRFRIQDGCDWQGINVGCDYATGQIWRIDADNRLDYETTPVTSTITGGLTKRFRENSPCYMAEVAVSEQRQPDGIDPSTVGIRLRTYDTINWYDHGTVYGSDMQNLVARFYGLGLMSPPGKLFEITDTGYARRIDGLNIETDNGSQ